MSTIGQKVALGTPITGLRRVMETNSTNTGFGSVINRAAFPSTVDGDNAAVDLALSDSNHTIVQPIGVGADTTTFSMRIWGWRRYAEQGNNDIWKAFKIGDFACALSTGIGVANTPQLVTERDCDTIAASDHDTLVVTKVHPTSANNTAGYILLDTISYRYLQIDFDMTGATSANALVGSF